MPVIEIRNRPLNKIARHFAVAGFSLLLVAWRLNAQDNPCLSRAVSGQCLGASEGQERLFLFGVPLRRRAGVLD